MKYLCLINFMSYNAMIINNLMNNSSRKNIINVYNIIEIYYVNYILYYLILFNNKSLINYSNIYKLYFILV